MALAGTARSASAQLFSYSGSIVEWLAPQTGWYNVTAAGAQGGSIGNSYGTARGGYGALMSADFYLTEGQRFLIAVGGAGSATVRNSEYGPALAASGGGGSFFVRSNSDGLPQQLLIAGGGGGAMYQNARNFATNTFVILANGGDGLAGELGGSAGGVCGGAAGGLNGLGGGSAPVGCLGSSFNESVIGWAGGGGAGFNADGKDGNTTRPTYVAGGGDSWWHPNGRLAGGRAPSHDYCGGGTCVVKYGSDGGFGGGGASSLYGAGGGGGAGGGAGSYAAYCTGCAAFGAGGGSSYFFDRILTDPGTGVSFPVEPNFARVLKQAVTGGATAGGNGYLNITYLRPPECYDTPQGEVCEGTGSVDGTVAPEPSTVVLLAGGLAGLAGVGMRRRRAQG